MMQFKDYVSNLKQSDQYSIINMYSCTLKQLETQNYQWPETDFKLEVQVASKISIFLQYTGTDKLGIPVLFHINCCHKESNIQHYRVTPMDSTIGYHEFTSTPDPKEGQIVFHFCTIQDPTFILFHNFTDYHSKLVTNFIGLSNQGATCYLNSLLQSLFISKGFIRYINTCDSTNKCILALQHLFYAMSVSETTCTTNELTHSFGWTTIDSFQQHDIQELLRVLQDNIEEFLKSNNLPNFIATLFGGTYTSCIECIDIDYTSEQPNTFYDVQLTVKHNKSLSDAFEMFLEKETLNGDNQYSHDGKKYDALKYFKFTSVPPILHLQSLRFEYDPSFTYQIKLNDHFSYPDQFDLLDTNYTLFAVLVHSGTVHHGHYFSFIKSDNTWLKCDDDIVTLATHNDVFDANFGGKQSAYMLVYFQTNMIQSLTAPITNTPQHVIEWYQQLLKHEKEQESVLFHVIPIDKFHPMHSPTDYTQHVFNKHMTWQHVLDTLDGIFYLLPQYILLNQSHSLNATIGSSTTSFILLQIDKLPTLEESLVFILDDNSCSYEYASQPLNYQTKDEFKDGCCYYAGTMDINDFYKQLDTIKITYSVNNEHKSITVPRHTTSEELLKQLQLESLRVTTLKYEPIRHLSCDMEVLIGPYSRQIMLLNESHDYAPTRTTLSTIKDVQNEYNVVVYGILHSDIQEVYSPDIELCTIPEYIELIGQTLPTNDHVKCVFMDGHKRYGKPFLIPFDSVEAMTSTIHRRIHGTYKLVEMGEAIVDPLGPLTTLHKGNYIGILKKEKHSQLMISK